MVAICARVAVAAGLRVVTSPFGLPMFSIMLLGQVQKFRYWIQDSVYG